MTVRETRNCTFRLEPDGYVLATMAEGAAFDLDDARAAVEAAWESAGRKRVPVLVDLRRVRSLSRPARQYFMSEEVAGKVMAVALLVESPLSRIIGGFVLRVGPHRVPTELFSGLDAARRWVASIPR